MGLKKIFIVLLMLLILVSSCTPHFYDYSELYESCESQEVFDLAIHAYGLVDSYKNIEKGMKVEYPGKGKQFIRVRYSLKNKLDVYVPLNSLNSNILLYLPESDVPLEEDFPGPNDPLYELVFEPQERKFFDSYFEVPAGTEHYGGIVSFVLPFNGEPIEEELGFMVVLEGHPMGGKPEKEYCGFL